MAQASLDCYEMGCCTVDVDGKICSFGSLILALNAEYAAENKSTDWVERKGRIEEILFRTELELTEINKYSMFSSQSDLPYTRNLVHQHSADSYTLLVLCWKPGFESKIHSHPVDGCFVMPLRGAICETLYSIDDGGYLCQTETKTLDANSQSGRGISFMSDTMGRLHKISNPSDNVGAVTLHLYTPSFSSCRVWVAENSNKTEERNMSLFSSNGIRTHSEEVVFDLASFI